MASASQITHQGKEIVFVNLARSDKQSALAAIDASESLIRTQPESSVLVLTDLTGSDSDGEVTDRLKKWAAGNKPYVKLSAIVGVSGAKKLLFGAVKTFTGRKNLKLFDNKDKALDWLTSG